MIGLKAIPGGLDTIDKLGPGILPKVGILRLLDGTASGPGGAVCVESHRDRIQNRGLLSLFRLLFLFGLRPASAGLASAVGFALPSGAGA